VEQRPRPAAGAADQVGDLVVAEDLRSGELVAAATGSLQRPDHALGDVGGPDRLVARLPGARDRHHGQEREPPQQRDPGVGVVVDDRGREDDRFDR
jgi:hypothetical protein